MSQINDKEIILGVITHNRPDNLKKLIYSIESSILDFGHDISNMGLLVIDNSEEKFSANNLDILTELKRKSNLDIYYINKKEILKFGEKRTEPIYELFTNHGASDLRNLAVLASINKKLILLDDDMLLTQSILKEKTGINYDGLLTSGRFLPLDLFEEMTYKMPLDIIKTTTSHLGLKIKDLQKNNKNKQGICVGNRDKTIDLLMLNGMQDIVKDTGNNKCFSHIETENIPLDSKILWQGLSAITGKADCHATASITGLSLISEHTVKDYGNLFVNYAIHLRDQDIIGIATNWKESTMAACGIINDNPIPSYPLIRGQDVSYRHMISENNPVAISPNAIDHYRSNTGRSNLSIIYWHELMGSKICKALSESIDTNQNCWNLNDVEFKLKKNQRKNIRNSIKTVCSILYNISNNGNPEMKSYSQILLNDLKENFGITKNNQFWLEQDFDNYVNEVAINYFDSAINRTKNLINHWPKIVEYAKTNGFPVRTI